MWMDTLETTSIESISKKVTDKTNYCVLCAVLLAVMCFTAICIIAMNAINWYYQIKQRSIAECLISS